MSKNKDLVISLLLIIEQKRIMVSRTWVVLMVDKTYINLGYILKILSKGLADR